jgi:Protein of unknown function (DUF4230)
MREPPSNASDERFAGKGSGMNARTEKDRSGWRPGPGGDQGDPPAGSPRPPRRWGGLIGLLIGIGSMLLVVALVVAALARFADWRPSLTNPFGTRTIERNEPALLLSLQDLSVYKAATANMQQLVDLEEDARLVPSFIVGERTLFVAVGSVDAEVDFSRIDKGAIKVSPDGRSAQITLPHPALGKVRIDPNASYVASRQRGILNRLSSVVSDDPNSQRELYQLADRRLREAALRTDVLARAEHNTRATLEGMLKGLGYTRVTVTFTESKTPN